MSLGQIAKQVGLPRSTVQRIAGALVDERLVISDSQGGGLRLGPEINALAEGAQQNIVEQCRLLLVELTQKTGETADLSVLRGAGMIFLDQVPGTQRLRTVSAVGEVFPLTQTANGRACLANMPREPAERLIAEEWRRTGVDNDMLSFHKLLDRVRETGLAYDIDEHTHGISAIGFAFRDWGGDLHAISVPMPSTRFDSAREKVEAALIEAAANVKKVLSN